jgi:hypothetical protein
MNRKRRRKTLNNNVCSKKRSPLNGENKNSAAESLYLLFGQNYSSFVFAGVIIEKIRVQAK